MADVADFDWHAMAAEVEIPRGLFIGGEVRDGAQHRDIVTPRDGSVLGTMAWATPADADDAVAAARAAFDDGPWSTMAPRERGDVLNRWADLLEEHRAEIALLITLEMGKPIAFSYNIELRAIVGCLRFYAGLADKVMGEIPTTTPGELALVTREPSGVVAAVVPWNFPLTIGGWKIGPALAAGCTVVLKTAEQSPLSMQRVAQLGHEAGLPDGVFNVLSGEGTDVGKHLGEHPDVDVLTFTGSTPVGRHFLRYAADSNVKRVHLELGGKSPNIVFGDAPDMDTAAQMAAWAVCFNQGEMCTAGSRLVVHEDIADEFVARVVAAAEAWQPGDPLDPATQLGPLVDTRALDRVSEQLERGLAQGGSVQTGGGRARTELDGPYFQPTVVTGMDSDNALIREELFAPILSVQTFADEAEALQIANDTEYGLAAGLWTADLGRTHRMSRALRAGIVWVNCYEEGDMTIPFGGVKLSGAGRDKSHHAIEEYTDLKSVWINYG